MQQWMKCVFLILLATGAFFSFAIYDNERMRRLLLLQSQQLRFPVRNSSKAQELKAYLDLTGEFKSEGEIVMETFNVFEALVRDGLVPTPVSMRESRDEDNSQRSDKGKKNIEASSPNSTALPLKVPNVVHYVFLGTDLHFTFSNYLSYRSVERFIKPEQVFVHGDQVPSGPWWNRTIAEVQNIYHVKRNYSKSAPNGQVYKYPAHISDYLRTEILLRYGGIYLDADVLVVKSFAPLRQHPVVMGREAPGALCNGIIIAMRGAPFLRLLLEQYQSYLGPSEIWAEKSVLNSDKLAQLYPHLVHVEETSLNRPNWIERAQIYDGIYNWRQNYAVHLWIRLWPAEKRPDAIKDILNKTTTLGEIARLIMFGSPEVRLNFTTTS